VSANDENLGALASMIFIAAVVIATAFPAFFRLL
jgi:hypothetical protein